MRPHICVKSVEISKQRVRLSSVTDDECNAVGVEDVAPLEAGRGVEVYLLRRVGGLADGIIFA